MPPVAEVTAAYQIENPTDKEVTMDFGFPILRGIYMRFGMGPYSDVRVQLDKDWVHLTVISNSIIYGIIRQNARKMIEKGIAADPELARRTAAVRAAWTKTKPEPGVPPKPPILRQRAADYLLARERLRTYLISRLNWNPRDAALAVEFASLVFKLDENFHRVHDGWWEAQTLNLGPLSAIGEQKATQLFAELASQFDKNAGTAYEAIFAAWGGDVRERSIDLVTGKIRPRELALASLPTLTRGKEPPPEYYDRRLSADPTVYARVDYLDPNAQIAKEDKESCQAILKNLPVVFTFAPMNLLYYQAKFAPHSTHAVTVHYRQYAYADTRGDGSYQLAYVLHPATLWKEFGPIRLTLQVPSGIACRASAAVHESGEVRVTRGFKKEELGWGDVVSDKSYQATVYQGTLAKPEEKNGELFVGIDMPAFDMFPPEKPQTPPEKPKKTSQSQK
jgi:hypothetical protein